MSFTRFRMNTQLHLAVSLAVIMLSPGALTAARPAAALRNKKAAPAPAIPPQERGIKQELDRRDKSKSKPQASGGRALGLVKALPAQSKRYALVIGIDQYADSQMSPLSGATNDAQMLARALVQYAGFPPDQVVLLASNQPAERRPTRGNILRRLSNLAAVVPKDGLLLFSFAGHGIERNNQAFLLPSDAQVSNDVTLLEQTAVNVLQIKDWIRKTGVRQVLLMLDACRNDPSAGRATAADNPLTKSYTRGFDFNVRNHEVTAFATLYATEIGSRAYEFKEKRQGYFTWAVVEGLKGRAANERGEVTLSGLVRYLQETVPRRVSLDLGQGRSQRPFAVVEGYRADELVLSVKGAGSLSNHDSDTNAAPPSNVEPSGSNATPAAETPLTPGGRDSDAANFGDLTGTTWTGVNPNLIDNEYTIQFLKNGKLTYSYNWITNGRKERMTVTGTWRQVAAFVYLTVNSVSTWQGKLDGATITGTIRNDDPGYKGEFMLLKQPTP